jgi:ribosome-binding ATPase YchF (GTP1/OBG family)
VGQTRGIYGEYLTQLQRADALIVVARAFDNPTVPDAGDGIDAHRDLETMLYELTFADLEVLDRRLGKLAAASKSAKSADRDTLDRERELISRLKAGLDDGIAVRNQKFGDDDARRVEDFQFLTGKPLVLIVNAGEEQLGDLDALEEAAATGFATSGFEGVRTAAICGQLEMELAQMDPEEEQEFRESLAAGESAPDRVVRLSFQMLDQITFFTGNHKEVRAWAIARGDTALRAAGQIHSDLERGFIRAEVVSYEDLVKAGSLAEAQRRGVFRQEGRSYAVADGDYLGILFNV